MPTGSVALYNKVHGFAFIRPDGGGANVFVHVSAFIRAGLPPPTEGQKVSFDIEVNPRDGKQPETRSVARERGLADSRIDNPAAAFEPFSGSRYQYVMPALVSKKPLKGD
jgi:cold shock protein